MAVEVPIDDFSMESYSQNSNDYLSSDSKDYSVPLLKPDYQVSQLKKFYNHYYSTDSKGLSPWSDASIKSILPIVKKVEVEILDDFDNRNKDSLNQHYGENFKAHGVDWINQIRENMDFNAINSSEFKAENKAIAIANTFARALPEQAPDFFHFSIAGQGFPFDNLQESVIWAATPLYVITVSEDKAWSLVLTPDAYFAWVKSSDIAYASGGFIKRWQLAAKKGLIAITKTGASVLDRAQHFQLTGYIGAVFPLVSSDEMNTEILIPIKNQHDEAVIKIGLVNKKHVALMPLVASKKNMVQLIKQLQNRPYGWGGAFFFNDCSQEMKSLFTPLGIWLPRNSAQQAQFKSTVDLSKNTAKERINLLKEQGHPLMTLIYIGGHVMLYVGNKTMDNKDVEAVTYQNVWGLSPLSKDKRYVIGQSLFLPLLNAYPEHPEVNSLANKAYFKLVYLDALDAESASPEAFLTLFAKTAIN